MNHGPCIVCGNPSTGTYGGDVAMPICERCYLGGQLRQWLDTHPERDPDAGKLPVRDTPCIVVGHENDGPLEGCVSYYQKGERPDPKAAQASADFSRIFRHFSR